MKIVWVPRNRLFATCTALIALAFGPHASPAEGASETVASKDGVRIAYERSGEGPVVVLVSSALSDRSGNARLAALLASRFTVVNYDRRGRGESGDGTAYSVEREVRDIEALIDGAGGSACLFGSSSGAVLALEAANALPGKVTRLALFEPPFITDDSRPPMPAEFVDRVSALVASGKRGEAVEYFMTHAVGVPAEAVAQMKGAPMWAGMEKLAHTLAYDGTVMAGTQDGKPLPANRWNSVTMPILILDGEKSDAYLRNGAGALAAVLPGARRHTLQGQDHSVLYSAPGILAEALAGFFSGPRATSDPPPRKHR